MGNSMPFFFLVVVVVVFWIRVEIWLVRNAACGVDEISSGNSNGAL